MNKINPTVQWFIRSIKRTNIKYERCGWTQLITYLIWKTANRKVSVRGWSRRGANVDIVRTVHQRCDRNVMSNINGHPTDPAERNESSARSAADVSKQWSADVAHVYRVQLNKLAEVVPQADVDSEVVQGSSVAKEDIRSPSIEEDFPPLDDEYLRECLGEYPDFLYHIARNKYGDVYFRVVRSLLLDKGNQIIRSNSVVIKSSLGTFFVRRNKLFSIKSIHHSDCPFYSRVTNKLFYWRLEIII